MLRVKKWIYCGAMLITVSGLGAEVDLRKTVDEILIPGLRTSPKLSKIGTAVKNVFQFGLDSELSGISTLRDCAKILLVQDVARLDPRLTQVDVREIYEQATAKEFYSGLLTTEFAVLAQRLTQLRQPERAALYYAMAVRYLALAPSLIEGSSHRSSITESAEVLLMDSRPHDAQVSTFTFIYSEIPNPENVSFVQNALLTILSRDDIGINPNRIQSAVRELLTKSFTGRGSKNAAVRLSRLGTYHALFASHPDPLALSILTAIRDCERLIGYPESPPCEARF